MALLFMDGFDHYNPLTYGTLKWEANVTGPRSWHSASGGRNGGGCTYFQSQYLGSISKTLQSTYQTLIIGVALQFQVPGASSTFPYFVGIWNGALRHIGLRRNSSTGYIEAYRGDGTLLGTYSVTLNAGVWYYLELKATISNTVGAVQLRVNEFPAISLSNIDTCNGGAEVSNKIVIETGDSAGNHWNGLILDDLYVCDNSGSVNNDFLGDCRIDVIRPNGAGYATNWTPSAGSNYQCVDDPLFDNGTDYVSENTVDDIDSYTFSDLPLGVAGIKGIQTNVFAKRTDSGVNTKLKPILRPVSTNYEKTEATLTTSYYDFTEITELNPETGLAWTKATIDAMELGLKLTANPLP